VSKFLIAFDTETGSLSPKQGDLLSAFFAVLDEDFNIVEELDMKLKPSQGLPRAEAGALKINGINIQKHIEDPETITYGEGKDKLLKLLKKYHKKQGRYSNLIPFGYNILGFDIGWVQTYLLPEEEWIGLMHYKAKDAMQAVDFLKDCSWLPPELGSLGTVNKYFSLPERNAHNAREDILMTIDVYKKLRELMDSKKGGGQTIDLIGLLEAE